MKKILLTGSLILSFISCSAQKADHDTKDLVNATAWMQNAGEYKALTIQAYQLAQIRLAQIITQEASEKPRAIVLDIDETVLDNSPYQAYQIENKKNSTRKTGTNGQDLLRQNRLPEL
jgi:5'-nucleotidase (lipoprotein e(P4) family)